MKYLITIDKPLIHEYHLQYLREHPKCRTLPFAKLKTINVLNKDGSPKLTKGGKQKTKKASINKKDYVMEDCLYGVMSLNEVLIIPSRMTMNAKKDKYGSLGEWIAEKYGLSGLNISNSLMEWRVYGETKANRDLDNISAGIKFLNDGLCVKSHFYVDDNYNHINPLLIVGDYDKVNPRTEVRISVFEEKLKNVYEKMKIHAENFKDSQTKEGTIWQTK